MERSKDKIDHYLTGSDIKLITLSDTTPSVDIGEEPNLRFIDHVPLFKHPKYQYHKIYKILSAKLFFFENVKRNKSD